MWWQGRAKDKTLRCRRSTGERKDVKARKGQTKGRESVWGEDMKKIILHSISVGILHYHMYKSNNK
jgi:hypothetical protein